MNSQGPMSIYKACHGNPKASDSTKGESIAKVTGPGVSLETDRGSFSVGCSSLKKKTDAHGLTWVMSLEGLFEM